MGFFDSPYWTAAYWGSFFGQGGDSEYIPPVPGYMSATMGGSGTIEARASAGVNISATLAGHSGFYPVVPIPGYMEATLSGSASLTVYFPRVFNEVVEEAGEAKDTFGGTLPIVATDRPRRPQLPVGADGGFGYTTRAVKRPPPRRKLSKEEMEEEEELLQTLIPAFLNFIAQQREKRL